MGTKSPPRIPLADDAGAARQPAGSHRPRIVRGSPEIPGYRIVGLIAQGATGTVYRARQLAVDREVALKVLHPEVGEKKRLVRRLQREARTTARLAHPHIVSAIDMGEVDGLWWFAMELVDGPSLALKLRQAGSLPEREALRLFIPLCEALVHMWEHRVVHRDIKPANILIDDTGGARLADLGLAFMEGDPVLTAQGGTLGTPHYISPEQACDPSSVDFRADIWSFGATLFHVVCGVPPFGGGSLAEILAGVLHSRVPDPHALNPALSRGMTLVLRKCLSRDLGLRYASPRELLWDLERIRERRAPRIDARALEPVHRDPRPMHVLMAVAGVVGLLVLVGMLLWLRRDREGSGRSSGAPTLELEEGIQHLYQAARQDPKLLATAIEDLAGYALTAPTDFRLVLQDMASKLEADLRRELRALHSEHEARVSSMVAARDFTGANAALGASIESKLRERTGFTSTSLPEQTGRAHRDWLGELRKGVEQAARADVDGLRRAAEDRLEQFVLPDVDRLVANRRWSSAMERISMDPVQLVEESGLSSQGVPRELLEDALASVGSRMSVRRDAIIDSWTGVDAELARWVERRAETLAEELNTRRLVHGAAFELEQAFARKLEDELIAREEILAPERAAVSRELGRRGAELSEIEDALLAADMEKRFELLSDVFGPLYKQRDYATLLAVWRDLRDEVESLPGEPQRPWRERMERRLAIVIREADLLDDLLARAATRVEELAGSELEFHFGNIRIRGVVELSAAPSQASFRIRSRGTIHDVVLREIASRDLLELAGIGDGTRDLPIDRLQRALLHFHDGNPHSALAALRSGPVPDDGEDALLSADLKDRALGALEVQREVQKDRLVMARELFEVVDSPRQGTYQISAVERLLDEFSDLAIVRDRMKELRERRDLLLAPRPRPRESDYLEAFGPTAVEMHGERVRLVFDFAGDGGGGVWERGSWTNDGEGWLPVVGEEPGGSRTIQGGPRLALRRRSAELDPKDELALRIQFDTPSPLGLIVISAAGFHVSMAGPASPGEGTRGWLATSGTLPEHLELQRKGRGSRARELFARDIHTIEVVLRRRSGRASVSIDGSPSEVMIVKPPRESSPLSVVEIRATGGLRLLRAEVEGDVP